jgi:hypothetical protein
MPVDFISIVSLNLIYGGIKGESGCRAGNNNKIMKDI